MTKTKNYDWVWFAPEVIREAFDTFCSFLDGENRKNLRSLFEVRAIDETWHYDSEEEFFADYRKNQHRANVNYGWLKDGCVFLLRFEFRSFPKYSHIHITFPTRSQIEAVYEVFERNVGISKVQEPQKPKPVKPTIFIGHGGNPQWRDVKDHLSDKHGYQVEAYEVGARSGHAIRDILGDMMNKSSFALLVLTGEDEQASGVQNPRLNVVHETGLFQGRLGFNRAVVLLEDGCEVFSNIQGIEQIRFSKGNIKETFGEILATLRREFG
jgi:predicted nucleotide-binding protein